MSFIGPRPERPEFVELFSSEVIGFEQRCLVTPGLTGLAQIQGGYDLTPQTKLKYDMKYIHKGSLMMELYISIRTLMVVITGEGSKVVLIYLISSNKSYILKIVTNCYKYNEESLETVSNGIKKYVPSLICVAINTIHLMR